MRRNSVTTRSPHPDQVIRERPYTRGAPEDLRNPRIVILIHGFANSERAAIKNYERFRKELRTALRGEPETGVGAFWEFHWPGDHPKRRTTLRTYPVRVPEASNAGRMLAEWLSEVTNAEQDVYLIGHSLGCRVALEAIRTMRRYQRGPAAYKGATVREVFLLAAAVPANLCSPRRIFGSKLPQSREHVFFSGRDHVLSWLFEPGQAKYGEKGPAVGLHGDPHQLDDHEERWDSRVPTSLGHSGYWKSAKVAEEICRILGIAGERSLPELSSAREELPPEGREVVGQQLPERYLPARGRR